MVGFTDVYRFLYAVIYVLTKYLVRRVIVNIIVQRDRLQAWLGLDIFWVGLHSKVLTLRGESYFLQIGWKIIPRKSLLTQVDIYRDSQVGNIYILSFQY